MSVLPLNLLPAINEACCQRQKKSKQKLVNSFSKILLKNVDAWGNGFNDLTKSPQICISFHFVVTKNSNFGGKHKNFFCGKN